ncbi:MAG: ABC transporter ATP-binding protein [Verrucomicrobiae bacterium]|nr:ABC transporter ATP-binding protein [Verrucomicrobiae bacterium]
MLKIELKDIHKAYGDAPVLSGVTLSVEQNEFFFLLGPSGCGKTTLLRMLAGFLMPDKGEIFFDGRRVNDVPAEKRGTPMVFQSYALWPHLSVFENVAYGLRVQGVEKGELDRRTRDALESTRIGALADRFPSQLSGGQQQRVAIARALAVNPAVLLFDEPLSNLDAKLRKEMRVELAAIHRERPFTAVYVTHDQEEAMTLASRIAVLDKGCIRQIGSPRELYQRPACRFVAEFMGQMNWVGGRVRERRGECWVVDTPVGILCTKQAGEWIAPDRRVLAGFRPGAARLDVERAEGDNRLEGVVEGTLFVGAYQHVEVRILKDAGGEPCRFSFMEMHPRHQRRAGERVVICLAADQVMVLPEEG